MRVNSLFQVMKRSWPRSLPDYAWPGWWLDSPRLAVLRWLLTGVFHASYAVGLVIGDGLRISRRVIAGIREHRPINLKLIEARSGDCVPRSVLVIRTDGLGDALLFEPALETLAQSLSPAELHLWAPPLACQILRNCPAIHRLAPLPRGFKDGNLAYFWSPIWRARLGFRLGFWNFEKVIYPADSPEPLGNWLAASARSRERWLNLGDTQNQFEWQRQEANRHATLVLESRPGNGHDLQRNAYLANQWGGALRLRRPRVHLDERALAASQRQMQDWQSALRRSGAESIVALLPAGSMPVKHYPAQSWSAVVQKLWEDHHAICALIGGPTDTPTLEELTGALGALPHLRMTRELDALATAALLSRTDAVLSVDNGMAHAAVAQNVPTIVLRTGGHPGRFFPWPGASRSLTLFKSMPCEGCLNRCHLEEPRCITQVEPTEIVAAYERLCIVKSPAWRSDAPMHVAV
jgi:ADP-heptose:LPS heptosyltransferase